MSRLAIAYACSGAIFLVLDGAFLTLAGAKLYRPELGALLGDKVRLTPAVLFYLIYVGGIVGFCVRPNLSAGWREALLAGAGLGLVAYGAYDLTCQAVLRVWSWKVTVVDIVWGTFVTAAASAVGVLATSALGGAFGLTR